jgi:hypothetical protein
MKNTIRVIAALVMIIATGLVHGAWTNRWRTEPALAALASRLDSLPKEIGDWTSVSRELPAKEQTMTGAVGYISRVYSNPAKGLSISVLLLAGLPGNITTHTPDACYPSAGFTLGATDPYSFEYGTPPRPAQFRTSVASRGGPNPITLRLFWAWHSSKGWSAPEDARWALGSEPMLSKLYVVREAAGAIVDPKEDPANEFMALLLPELDRIMAGPGQSAISKSKN